MSANIRRISDHRRKKKPLSIEEAVRAAAQHARNVSANDLDEPQGLASGDMEKFLKDPEAWEREGDDEH